MTIFHPLDPQDAAPAETARQLALVRKGVIMGAEARPMFDVMRAATPPAEGVEVAPATVGGVPGFWCRPPNATPGACILFLHGGGYVVGSAAALTNFASQIAARAGADLFVADYRLAPEHLFPAAIDDAEAAYHGLVAEGRTRIALAGDSAGGGLALALLSILAAKPDGVPQSIGAAAMSPWVDLALTGVSFETRAEADPIFTRASLAAFADTYLQGQDPTDPRASPLYAALAGLPPIRIDVGDDELLLDDATVYADRARAAGVDVTLAIWAGMPHVFQSGVGRYRAAQKSFDAIGEFLRGCIARTSA